MAEQCSYPVFYYRVEVNFCCQPYALLTRQLWKGYLHLSENDTVYDFDDDQYVLLSRVWHLLIQLHHEQRGLQQQGIMGPLGVDLDGLWQDHPNPLVAYGFTAFSPPDWEKVKAPSYLIFIGSFYDK